MTIAARALVAWVILMTLEAGNGLLRRGIAEQFVDDFAARQIGVVTGSLLVVAAAYLLAKWLGAERTSTLLLVGLSWAAMTLALELLLGRILLAVTWNRIWSDYDVPAGGLVPFGLLVMVLAPLIGARSWRRRRIAKRRRRRLAATPMPSPLLMGKKA